MKFFFDFLKILPDTAPLPNFVDEKLFITKAYIKSIDGQLLAHF
jgi:hypothetical protein